MKLGHTEYKNNGKFLLKIKYSIKFTGITRFKYRSFPLLIFIFETNFFHFTIYRPGKKHNYFFKIHVFFEFWASDLKSEMNCKKNTYVNVKFRDLCFYSIYSPESQKSKKKTNLKKNLKT